VTKIYFAADAVGEEGRSGMTGDKVTGILCPAPAGP
jgi:hypothetical protein